jgi:hypothetical protein
MSSRHPGSTPSGPPAAPDHIEYVVRPGAGSNAGDTWLIEHAGDRYGPYKNCREATLFAIDAARKLGAQGKSTRVKAVDHAGHLLTTWNYGARNPAF